MLLTAVLAWWIIIDSSSLATLVNVVITAHALPSGELLISFALGADEAVEKFLSIVDINTNTGAVIPLIATTVAVDHHTVIIRSTTEAVLSTIIAIIIR